VTATRAGTLPGPSAARPGANVPPHDQPTTSATPDGAASSVAPGSCCGTDPAPPLGIVDWHRTARRLRWQLGVILAVVVVAWLVLGVRAGGPTLRSLAELTGLGVLAAIVAEIVVVGGAALRGMLAAGARGDRLASSDVALLPPQVRRRLARRR
jgi:hypothetical protein